MEYTSGPISLPDYPQMIMAAIEALGEKEGSNGSAISSYIESNYSDLPGDHAALLSDTLEKMKDSAQLVFADGNYLKPDLDVPAKRGRGRPRGPRKNKTTPPPPAVTGSTRSRGRPPKPKDPLAAAPAPVPKKAAGRPRGRQPKKAEPAAAAAPVAGVKRGRGRPPKVRPAATPPVATVGA